MKFHKRLFTIIFIISMFGISIYNFKDMQEEIVSGVMELDKPKTTEDFKNYSMTLDTILVQNLTGNNFWNEAYGAIYNAIGKNEENSYKYVRDKNGHLFAGDFKNIPSRSEEEVAISIRRLMDIVNKKGTKLVVMIYPSQYNEKWSDGYYGMVYQQYNNYNEELFRWFRYYDIPYIDYKTFFEESGKSESELFFKTDHHWTTATSFEAFRHMVEYLNDQFDENLDEYYIDYDNYKVESYTDAFIGSQGRNAGVSYVGTDNYDCIIPKFEQSYDVYHYGSDMQVKTQMSGNATDALINRKKYYYESDYYSKDLYGVYAEGVYAYTKIVNNSNEDGLKVFYIRDSYASPIGVFFSSYCSLSDMVWSSKINENAILKKIETEDYDYVFVAMAVDSVASSGFTFTFEDLEVNAGE